MSRENKKLTARPRFVAARSSTTKSVKPQIHRIVEFVVISLRKFKHNIPGTRQTENEGKSECLLCCFFLLLFYIRAAVSIFCCFPNLRFFCRSFVRDIIIHRSRLFGSALSELEKRPWWTCCRVWFYEYLNRRLRAEWRLNLNIKNEVS